MFESSSQKDNVEHEFGFAERDIEEYAAKLETKSESKAIQSVVASSQKRSENEQLSAIDFLGTEDIENELREMGKAGDM